MISEDLKKDLNNFKTYIPSKEETVETLDSFPLFVIQKMGNKCPCSDIALMSGFKPHIDSKLLPEEVRFYRELYNNNNIQTMYNCNYFLLDYEKGESISDIINNTRILDYSGFSEIVSCFDRNICIRPFIKCSKDLIEKYCTEKRVLENGIIMYALGEYPQFITDDLLKKDHNSNSISFSLPNSDLDYNASSFIDHMFSYEKTGELYSNDNRRFVEYRALYTNGYFIPDTRLSNNEICSIGYFEVSPVWWYFDERKETLVSVLGLLSGVNRKSFYQLYPSRKSSQLVKYLERVMLIDLFANLKPNSIEIKEDNFVKLNHIQESINELIIELLNCSKDIFREVETREFIRIRIDRYNEALEKLKDFKGLALSNKESLYQEIIKDLNNMILEYKIIYKTNIICFEISNYILEIENVFLNKDYNSDKELIIFLKRIKYELLPLLGDDEIKYNEKLVNILSYYKNEFITKRETHENNYNSYAKYTSLEVFEKEIRNRLNDFLEDIRTMSRQKEEKGLKDFIYKASIKSYVKMYELEIKKLLNGVLYEYRDKYMDLFNIYLTNNDLDSLAELYKSLIGLEYEINFRNSQNVAVDEYKIDFFERVKC